MKNLNKTNVSLMLAFCSALLSACSGSEQLPAGTSVTVTPTAKSITMVAVDPNQPVGCFTEPDTLYQDVPVLISVTNDQGSPLGEVTVGVYADYSGNTFSGPEVLQIFADSNGNGVVDAETELVSGSLSGVYETETDKYHGTVTVFVRMNLTCPYVGDLYVYAGPNSATVEFEVIHEGTSTTSTTVEP